MVSNGMQNTTDRAVMPVVSMSPGQMTSVMGNMIVQAVPGITTMTSGLAIPAGQAVQVGIYSSHLIRLLKTVLIL